LEQSKASYKTLSLGPGLAPVEVMGSFSAKGTFGGSVLGNDNLQGSTTTDPTEQTLYTLFVSCTDGVSSSNIVATVEIEYIAVWEELKDMTES
jgi:hypothetical protein